MCDGRRRLLMSFACSKCSLWANEEDSRKTARLQWRKSKQKSSIDFTENIRGSAYSSNANFSIITNVTVKQSSVCLYVYALADTHSLEQSFSNKHFSPQVAKQ